MNMLMNLFRNISSNYICGININEKNGFFEIIELRGKNKSFIPVFSLKNNTKKFISENVFRKKEFVGELKKNRDKIKSKIIFLSSMGNKKLETEIAESLKILGFEKIIVKEKNIKGIILGKNNYDFDYNIHHNSDEIIIYKNNEHYIERKNILKTSDFNPIELEKFLKNIDEQYVFLSAENFEDFQNMKKIFLEKKIKSQYQNIWKNFLNFSDGIPNIHLKNSFNFLNVLSITIPDLKNWELLDDILEKEKIENKENILEEKAEAVENVIEEKIETVEEIKEEGGGVEKKFLPKRKKKFLPKPKKIKNAKISTDANIADEKTSIEKKIYLPKNKSNKSFWGKLKKTFHLKSEKGHVSRKTSKNKKKQEK